MKYLIHIGYPKAASTWLQSTILSGLDERIQPLKGSFYKSGACKSGDRLFYDNRIEKITSAKQTLNNISPFFHFKINECRFKIQSLQNPSALVTCLSNETWTGHPYSGGVHGKIYLERINAVLPTAKILIIVRNPVSAILSAYVDFMDRGIGICKFEDFLFPKKTNQIPNFSIHYYRYIELIEAYDDSFGKNNVIIVPLENLANSVLDFITPIYKGLELPLPKNIPKNIMINKKDYRKLVIFSKFPFINLLSSKESANGYGAFGWKMVGTPLRRSYHFIPKKLANNIKKSFKEKIIGHFGEYIRDGNRALEKRMNIDLRSLGYLI